MNENSMKENLKAFFSNKRNVAISVAVVIAVLVLTIALVVSGGKDKNSGNEASGTDAAAKVTKTVEEKTTKKKNAEGEKKEAEDTSEAESPEEETIAEEESDTGASEETTASENAETTTAATDTTSQNSSEAGYTYTEMDQTMYAKSTVNVRIGPSTDFEKVGALSQNQSVHVTGICNETGWYRIDWNGQACCVADGYLVNELVTEAPTQAATQENTQTGSTGNVSGEYGNFDVIYSYDETSHFDQTAKNWLPGNMYEYTSPSGYKS